MRLPKLSFSTGGAEEAEGLLKRVIIECKRARTIVVIATRMSSTSHTLINEPLLYC